MYSKKEKLFFFFSILLFLLSIFMLFEKQEETATFYYISSNKPSINLMIYNSDNSINVIRGTKVKYVKKEKGNYIVLLDKKKLLVDKINISDNQKKVINEKVLYVRTPVTLYKEGSLSFIKKGEELVIAGYDKYDSLGIVNKYLVNYNNEIGYVYGKYLVEDKETALLNYDYEKSYQIHLKRGNTLGGGSAANLDYYPVAKPVFNNNVMPDRVNALYLNAGVLKRVDEYINIAKESGINAFVVDIKDNTFPGYKSKVMEKYSPTNYKYAANSLEGYQAAIKKLKDNGFYVIGRITVFKDSYYIADHPESAIKDTTTNLPFKHNGSYWPSAYMRDVWEFNVELAKEAVTMMGFNEIQFDYVRFPDRINYLENQGLIDYINPYHEEKAEAIQNFAFYATDELHSVNAYISFDVFGESAHNYVTAYGQYFGAISNVVDVISPMPYPDHFSAHEYNFTEVVWTVPYKLISYWGTNYVNKRQLEIPTPAKVRSWIQTYDTNKNPAVIYDSSKVGEQIDALCDSGLKSGFMTWSASSSINKYTSLKDAFGREC